MQWSGRADLTSLREVSEFLTGWLKTIEGYRQLKGERYLVELAVMEALTNIIRYAYPDRADGEVRIFLRRRTDSIEIEIQDRGRSFDPAYLSPPSLQNPREGGYGVFLMKKIMNAIWYERKEDNVNSLTMIRELPKEDPHAERPEREDVRDPLSHQRSPR